MPTKAAKQNTIANKEYTFSTIASWTNQLTLIQEQRVKLELAVDYIARNVISYQSLEHITLRSETTF